MRPRFPESEEERAARLVGAAARLAAKGQAGLESGGAALPSRGLLAARMARRLRKAGLPAAAARPIARDAARHGLDLIEAAGRGDLRHEDLRGADRANLEAVISVTGRPAWFVRDNATDVNEGALDASDDYWLVHIGGKLIEIASACRGIGAIFLEEDGARTAIGTGWMIGTRLLATNAHVARHLYFRRNSVPAGDPLDGWRPLPGITGYVDFRFEHGGNASNGFTTGAPCFVETDEVNRPDLAVIALQPRGGDEPPKPILPELNPDRIGGWSGALVFVLGHPVADVNDDTNVGAVFGALDGTKRISPGETLGRLGAFVLAHDCSTVNGSSGSPVLDFASVNAVGLHYWGQPGARNESVFLPAIRDHPALLKSLGGGFGV